MSAFPGARRSLELGALNAAFYDDVVTEQAAEAASIRFVATTVPGFGDTEPLPNPTMDGITRLCGELASHLGADAVVGHSVGGNLALEMAATGAFSRRCRRATPGSAAASCGATSSTSTSTGRWPPDCASPE